jgi:hypothetical protein
MSRTRTDVIRVLLQVIAEGLQEAETYSISAAAAAAAGETNLAIGTAMPLEDELPLYASLLTATLALHRRRIPALEREAVK